MFSVADITGARTRPVTCYSCAATFDVPARALVLTCPHCYQRVKVDDVVVYDSFIGPQLRTCGSILVARKGVVQAGVIQSSKAIEVLGRLHGQVRCAGPVFIGPKAVWEGDVTATHIIVEPGATILGGLFRVQR